MWQEPWKREKENPATHVFCEVIEAETDGTSTNVERPTGQNSNVTHMVWWRERARRKMRGEESRNRGEERRGRVASDESPLCEWIGEGTLDDPGLTLIHPHESGWQ